MMNVWMNRADAECSYNVENFKKTKTKENCKAVDGICLLYKHQVKSTQL